MGKSLSFLDKVFVGLLLVVFGGVVLHAPLSVGFSTALPDSSLLIKSWKEVLLGVALLVFVVILTIKKQWGVMRSGVVYCIAAFAALHVALIPLFYTGTEATAAALLINLRFFLMFVLVYGALRLYPQLHRLFFAVFVGGALVVVTFAVLQSTVLPRDVLKHIGYGESTIMPYLTVDENDNYVRINSTLRGPNPLGLYAAIVLTLVVATVVRAGRVLKRWEKWLLWALGVGGAVALWASYSRSAALAALAAIGIVMFVVYGRQISKGVWIGLMVVGLALTGSVVALRDTQFISQVILHEDPHEGNDVNSNDEHADSLIDGTRRMIAQPLGGGVGSTGSASLLTDEPLIIENQYLFIAHEVGWPGLALFAAVYYLVLVAAWRRRAQWLALGVFASGVGIAIAGMFLPVWVDDTVAIVWWGLAAMVVAWPVVRVSEGKKS